LHRRNSSAVNACAVASSGGSWSGSGGAARVGYPNGTLLVVLGHDL